MKIPVLATALIAAVALAAPAEAASKKRKYAQQHQKPAVAQPNGYTVYDFDGRVAGRDPDPFIRAMISERSAALGRHRLTFPPLACIHEDTPMKSTVLVTALIATVALAVPAEAAAKKRKAAAAPPQTMLGGQNAYQVWDGTELLGADPDPFIRLMIRRAGRQWEQSGR